MAVIMVAAIQISCNLQPPILLHSNISNTCCHLLLHIRPLPQTRGFPLLTLQWRQRGVHDRGNNKTNLAIQFKEDWPAVSVKSVKNDVGSVYALSPCPSVSEWRELADQSSEFQKSTSTDQHMPLLCCIWNSFRSCIDKQWCANCIFLRAGGSMLIPLCDGCQGERCSIWENE
jgi:hypothetical protein